MTALSKRKTKLTFETADTVRERGRLREVVIEAQPFFCLVRLKGMRSSMPISYGAIYHVAAKIAAEKRRAEHKAARKAKP
jgi:hypothetical protein